MLKAEKTRLFLISNIIFILILVTLSSSIAVGQDDPFDEIQEKMIKISDDEKEILENLFILAQEIEAKEKEKNRISQEIEVINYEIDKLEVIIANEEIVYEKKLNALTEVLKSYQRKGPGSYLEIILSSENLTMLLRRFNTLRDLTRGTGELLEALDASKENMSIEKAKFDEKLVLVEDKQRQLKVSLDSKLRLKDDMETYLASLEEDRANYQEYLDNVQQMWDRIIPLFSGIKKAFSNIIEEENLPEDAIDITFSIFGIKGSIDEKTFNDIIAKHPLLSKMILEFEANKMTMYLSEESLILSGEFVVLEGNILKFEINEGSFYGMTLEPSTIDELFEEDYLTINVQPLIGDNTLRSVEIEKGKINLTIIPNLF